MTRSTTRPATPTTDKTPAKISTGQMRRMHALLRDHGIHGDKAVHDYITADLREHGEDPVEHRSDLTTTQAARIIADLESDEVVHAPHAGPSVVEALASVMNHVRAVSKDSQAPSNIGGYRFRGVDAVVNAVAPALREAGVIVMPEVLHVDRVTTQSRQGANMLNVYVTTRYTFHGPAGDSVSTTVLGEAADAGDKATAKAQSVALRVALLQALMLPTDDVDPDAEGYERGEQQPAPEPPPYVGPTADELHDIIASYADRAGISVEQITEKWRAAHNLTMEQYADLPPQALAALERVLGDYIAAHPDEFRTPVGV